LAKEFSGRPIVPVALQRAAAMYLEKTWNKTNNQFAVRIRTVRSLRRI